MSTANHGPLGVPISHMLERWPLLGAIIASWEIVSGGTPTLGIGMGRAGLRLYFNPDFVAELTDDQIITVLLHEVRHLIYGHLFQDPATFSDPHALVIAQEVTVNENIPGDLPDGAVVLSNYPDLPPDEDTLTRYYRLKSGQEDEVPDNGPVRVRDASLTSPCPHPDETPDDHRGNRDGCRGKDDSNCTGDLDVERDGHGTGAGTLSHDHWPEVMGQETLVRAHIEGIAQRIQAELDAGEVVVSGDEVTILKSILGQGLSTAGQYSRIENTGNSTVNWRQQLRRWVGQAAASTYSIQSPSRRYPHLLGIVPGRRRQSRRPRILVGLDTSGSISHEQLEDFCAELTKLARGNDIWIAEVDFVVHDLYRYRRAPTIMTGRGGTSFMPLFEQEVLRRARPDLIVYLTDGEGAAPTTAPPVPVLWVLTQGGEKPSIWGQAIWLEGVFRC